MKNKSRERHYFAEDDATTEDREYFEYYMPTLEEHAKECWEWLHDMLGG